MNTAVTEIQMAEVDMNAARYVWLRDNWHSSIDGVRVPVWISSHALRYGGISACIDQLMFEVEVWRQRT